MLTGANHPAAIAEVEAGCSIRDCNECRDGLRISRLHHDCPHSLMARARLDMNFTRGNSEDLFAQTANNFCRVWLHGDYNFLPIAWSRPFASLFVESLLIASRNAASAAAVSPFI